MINRLKISTLALWERTRVWGLLHKKTLLFIGLPLLLLILVTTTILATGHSKDAPAPVPQVELKNDIQPQTEEYAKIVAQQYWDAVIARNYARQYDLSDNQLRSLITKDEYVKRQDWLDKNTAFGNTPVQSVEIVSSAIQDTTYELVVNLVTVNGKEVDNTTMIYEGDAWHRVFKGYDVLKAGKTFDEFVAQSSD